MNLDRPVLIHICKDGTFTYRRRHESIFNGKALPVLSVECEAEAEALQIMTCRLQRVEHPLMPGKPWYVLNEFEGTIEGLLKAGEELEHQYEKYVKGKF